jgi:predicted RNA polymerase sigma factor
VRGDLLDKLGRHREAEVEFELAAALAQNERERQLSAQRLQSSRRRANDAPSMEGSG